MGIPLAYEAACGYAVVSCHLCDNISARNDIIRCMRLAAHHGSRHRRLRTGMGIPLAYEANAVHGRRSRPRGTASWILPYAVSSWESIEGVIVPKVSVIPDVVRIDIRRYRNRMEDFIFENLTAGGLTEVGAALEELGSKLSREKFLKSMTGADPPAIQKQRFEGSQSLRICCCFLSPVR